MSRLCAVVLDEPWAYAYLRHVPTDELVSTSEAAAILGVDTRTVHRMVHDGRLPTQTKFAGLRGAYVFSRVDVERVRDELAAAS